MRPVAGALAVVALSAMLGGCAGYSPATGPAYGYPQAGAAQGTVRCESDDGRMRRCAADVRGGVGLSKQLSRAPCVQGRTWGHDARGIWVDDGCRAEFVVGDGAGAQGQRTIRCESEDGRERHCAATLRGAALRDQRSRTPCVQGRNWRWDRTGIWVKDGCRADFAAW